MRKLVVASSRAVYGEGTYRCAEHGLFWPTRPRTPEGNCYDVRCPGCDERPAFVPSAETSPLRPCSVYAVTKCATEQLLAASAAAIGVPYTALRFQNVYGPGQSLSNPYTGIVMLFVARVMCGKPIILFEDGEQSRDYVHVADVTGAIEAALDPGVADGQVVNVGSGFRIPHRELVRVVFAAVGREVVVEMPGIHRLGDIRHACADLRLAKQLLGIPAGRSFMEGIKELVSWAQHQPFNHDRYEASIEEFRTLGLLRAGT